MRKPSARFLLGVLLLIAGVGVAAAFAIRIGHWQKRTPAAGPGVSQTQSSLNTYTGDISSRQNIPFFIFVGDTQRTSVWERLIGREQNDEARQAVLQKIADENPAFLVILGDLVFQGDSRTDWQRFDLFAAPIRQRGIPVFPLPGNHEYFGNNKRGFELFFDRFPYLRKRLWYDVRFGSVAIVLLDSNFDKMGRELVAMQDEWYKARLAEYQTDPSVKTVIVCCHHAPFTNSTVVSDDVLVQQHFVEPFKEAPKAKLFFTGHCHSYERFTLFGKQFVVSGGGGGPRQKLVIDPKRRKHEDQFKGGAIREFNFCKVTPEPKGLRVQMIEIDNDLKHWSVGDDFLVN